MINKLLRSTSIIGIGMVSQSIDCVKDLKPNKILGCYTHKPTPKAYVILDTIDPMDLNKAKFILLLDSKETLVLNKCLVLKTIQKVKFEKWYRCTTEDKFVVRFNSDNIRKKLNDVCSSYRNCIEINEEIEQSLRVASARYYDLMKKNKMFPGQKII